MPSSSSKVRAWDNPSGTRAILNDLRWENVWRKSKVFRDLPAEEKLRWRKHIVDAPASMPIGRLLRYEEYLDASEWSTEQLERVKALEIRFPQKKRIKVEFPTVVSESTASFVPHLAPRANRAGLGVMIAGAARSVARERNTFREFQGAEVWVKENGEWATTKYGPQTLEAWAEEEQKKYSSDETQQWFKTNDVYDDSLLHLYQEAELQTLASRIGSRVHERLMATMIEEDGTVYAPLLPDGKVPQRLRELLLDEAEGDERTGAGFILGYSDHTEPRNTPFYKNLVTRLLAFFGPRTKAAAVEYPVHHPNLCVWKTTKLVLFETRLDAVLKLDAEYVVVEFKTIGGSKWSLQNPITRISKTSLWDDALEQALIGARLFHLNTTLTVSWLVLVFIERKRTVQHIFKVKNNPERGKKLVQNLFDGRAKKRGKAHCVYVDEKGVCINKTKPNWSVQEAYGPAATTIKLLSSSSVPELRPIYQDADQLKWRWNVPETNKAKPQMELEHLVGHRVTYKERSQLVIGEDTAAAEPTLFLRNPQGRKIRAPLSKLKWSKAFANRVSQVKCFYTLHFLEEEDELIRERSALFEVVLLLNKKDSDTFFEDHARLNLFKVARELFYDRKNDRFYWKKRALNFKMKNTPSDDVRRPIGIAPTRRHETWDDFAKVVKGPITQSATQTIKKNLGDRIKLGEGDSGDIQRDFEVGGLRRYHGWISNATQEAMFPRSDEKWQTYKAMLNAGYEEIATNSVYPTGWCAVTRYRARHFGSANETRKEKYRFEPLLPTRKPQRDKRLSVQSWTFPEFVKRFLKEDENPDLIRHLRETSKFKARQQRVQRFNPSSALFRAGLTPLMAHRSSNTDQIAVPQTSTTLAVPEEREQLHASLLAACKVVEARVGPDVKATQSTATFTKACQAFESTARTCAGRDDKYQAFEVTAYRTLNRRINRKIASKYALDKPCWVHSSSRTMWSQAALKYALSLVDESREEMVEALRTWKPPLVDGGVFVDFDY